MTSKGSGAREIEQPLEPDRPFIIDLMADACPDMDDELSRPAGGNGDSRAYSFDGNYS